MVEKPGLRIAVIGAGASGLIAAVKLIEAGFDDVVIFEKADELGGTWRDNIYPGLTCDVPSHAYRLSFAPNPDWTQVCASGAEILAYLKKTARDFDIDRHIRFGEEVIEAHIENHRWHLTTNSGAQGEFDIVITATGVLHHPVYPQIAGLDSFAGEAFHSARWSRNYDWSGKRVGIIGTGSTATQIVSAMAGRVAKLSLFQRTAQWVFPQSNEDIPEETKQMYRADPDLLDRDYRQLLSKINATFAASLVGENPSARAKIVKACEDYLATVKDPDLRARLTPDYTVGCKRLVMSDTFYEAMQTPGVELVTERIVRCVPNGLETADGSLHELDLIVMATGFNTHQFFRPMQVTGRNGLTIEQAWADRNRGYNTVSVPGFPNWFMLGGPSSPIGNFSWLLTAETQFAYVLQLIEKLRDKKVLEIEPKEAAVQQFEARLAEQIPRTVWATGCSSWYVDPQGNVASWPWTFDKFVEELKVPRWDDFEIVRAEGTGQ
ncbi:putative flavin-containing monooxygenase [Novosphingobium resinovorum]|uniref:Putative flavin-containing monooxygenase n=1 Tax=Novosphingobium resinovorum TaxID=158500 RepID=A0A031K248_9SPHN|nr:MULTISPECIES: NAD(P)/FAD-dependent oxidoreductase [Novosphingobium]EZP83108.1 putative flavin-containing monooxygenase [Novosphingobium resinovorum]